MTIAKGRRSFLVNGVALAAASGIPGALGAPPDGAVRPRYGFGWIKDRPDPGDRLLKTPAFRPPAERPEKVDLAMKLPSPYDQGRLGSCTANAIAAAVQYARRENNMKPDFVPSRLFIYYYERKFEDSIRTDNGAQIRDGIKAVAQLGVCSEDDWKYDSPEADERTHVFPAGARAIQEPPANLRKKAKEYRAISYAPLTQSEAALETALASGYPFIFGFDVYDNFDDRTKLLKKPGPKDKSTSSGHAVLVVGYDNKKRTFRIRNSWGSQSNDRGHFDMDYDYVLSNALSADFWVIYQTNAFM